MCERVRMHEWPSLVFANVVCEGECSFWHKPPITETKCRCKTLILKSGSSEMGIDILGHRKQSEVVKSRKEALGWREDGMEVEAGNCS